jgi:hypothetical protein
MFPIRPRLASFIALSLISIFGVLLVIRATPQGLGLSDDRIHCRGTQHGSRGRISRGLAGI